MDSPAQWLLSLGLVANGIVLGYRSSAPGSTGGPMYAHTIECTSELRKVLDLQETASWWRTTALNLAVCCLFLVCGLVGLLWWIALHLTPARKPGSRLLRLGKGKGAAGIVDAN